MRLRHELDTRELPADEASRVEGAVRDLAGHAPQGPPHPDAFRYEIAPVGDTDLAPILLDERDVPPELHGLLDAVAESGEIEGPDRGGPG